MMIRAIDPTLVDVGERLRENDPDWVETLAEEMKTDGLLEPIRVVECKGRIKLVAGALRLAAAIKLGWREIDARIDVRAFLDQAAMKLAEIKSNLMRAELTVLDRAVYVSTWRDIYLAGHKLPKRGGRREKGVTTSSIAKPANDDAADLFAVSLVEAAKRALDLSQSALYRALKIASIGRRLRQRLARHWLADNQAQLLKLAEQDVDRQAAIVDLMLAEPPEAESVADAIAILDGIVPVASSPAERVYSGLSRLTDAQAYEVFALDQERIERWQASLAKPPRKLRRVV